MPSDPPTTSPPDRSADPDRAHPAQGAWDYNARVGLILFAVYLALYGGFIWLSAFSREAMARPVLLGVNLAIVYGFGLIVAAFVLAMVYMFLCKREPDENPEMTEGEIVRKAEEEGGL